MYTPPFAVTPASQYDLWWAAIGVVATILIPVIPFFWRTAQWFSKSDAKTTEALKISTQTSTLLQGHMAKFDEHIEDDKEQFHSIRESQTQLKEGQDRLMQAVQGAR